MVLLRRRDCAGGTGPVVDAPSVDVPGPVAAGAVVLAGAVAAVAGAWEVEEEVVVWRPWNKPGAG
jgi:hypothetical protein